MKRIYGYLFLVITLNAGIIFTATAQQEEATVKLDLGTVIQIAKAQSPDALIAKHRFRRSYWEFRSYKAANLPLISMDAILPNFSRQFRRIQVPDGPDIFQYNSLANTSLNLSINQRIAPTGGSIFLQSSLQRLDNFYTDSTLTSYQTTPIIIGYQQPLFQHNQLRWDKKIEPLKYEKAKREYMEDMEQVAITATNRFFNLLDAQIQKDIAIKNLSNYDTLYRIARGRFNLGMLAENNLLQLELNFLEAEGAVEEADLNFENRLFELKSYLRLKDDSRFELIPPVDTKHFEVSSSMAITEAKDNTSQSLEFRERLLEVESEVRRAKMDGRFDADLYVEYGLTQSAYEFNESYTNPQDQQRVTLGLSIPIVDWGVAKGNIRMAESSQELEMTAVEQEMIDFEQQVFLNVMRFNMQERQIKIAAKADTVAQRRFDVTQKRYMIGKVNDVLELNNAQIDNDRAKQSYYSQLRNYWNNYFELRRLTLFDFERGQKLIFDIREVM